MSSGICDVEDFLRNVADIIPQLNGETVMVVGCGSGLVCRALLSMFPKIEEIKAIDHSKERINRAVYQFSHKKIQYHVADILDGSSLKWWWKEMTLVVSIYYFNSLTNQELAFRNLYRLLNKHGRAAVLLNLNPGIYDFLVDFSHSKNLTRQRGMKDAISQLRVQKYTADRFRHLLVDISFEILHCQEEVKVHSYQSDEQCRNEVFGFISLCTVPKDGRQEFMNDAFETYLKHNPRDAHGKPCMYHHRVSLMMRKDVLQ